MEFIRKMSVYTNTIQTMYITYFNRPADVAGLANWDAHMAAGMSEADLEAAFAASAEYAALTPAQQAANAATVVDADMIAAAVAFTDAADATYSGAAANVIGSAWLAGDYATVADAISAVAGVEPEPEPEDGEGMTEYLTSGSDRGGEFNGTNYADTFNAYLEQNSFAGGVSNSLSSADVLNGGGGADSLFAELVPEYFGVTGDHQIDVQPRTADIENVTFEARDAGGNNRWDTVITVDAKNMTGIDEIGSLFSDGDLVIENLTTLDDAGNSRNTDALTITMDHTDNFNSDRDASDLTVYFDEDYLLAGQTVVASQANYWMIDEDSSDYNLKPLENIERNGVNLTIDDEPYTIAMDTDTAAAADTWAAFAAGLQAVIDASGNPAFDGLTVRVDDTNPDSTYNDDGVLITMPAITIDDAQGRVLVPTGFESPEDTTGGFDIYGNFDNVKPTKTANDVTINIDLEKVGRDGEGGDLTIGGKELDYDDQPNYVGDLSKNKGDGIPVFEIDVLGNAARPSNLGVIQSTNGDLTKVNVETHADYVDGGSFASLTVRDGFVGNNKNPMTMTFEGVESINANALKGALDIGQDTAQYNTDTFTATGGGNVTYNASIDGREKGAFTNKTGSGNDKITVNLHGNAVDTASTLFLVDAGAGNNTVDVTMQGAGVSVATTRVLDNLDIVTGSGDDTITLTGGGIDPSTTIVLTDPLVLAAARAQAATDATAATAANLYLNTAAFVDAAEAAAALTAAQAADATAAVSAWTVTSYELNDSAYWNAIMGIYDGDADFNISSGGGTDTVHINSMDDWDSVGASTGSWGFGSSSAYNPTSDGQPFQSRVLYHATLTVAYAGFESTVDVKTDISGKFIANQMTINDAIMSAIGGHSEIGRLLETAEGTASQRLMVTSNYEGENGLSIALNQPTLVSAGTVAGAGEYTLNASDFVALGQGLVQTNPGTFDSDDVATSDLVMGVMNAPANMMSGSLSSNGMSTGTPFYSETSGWSSDEQSITNVSTIDMGAGAHDLVILNSHDNASNTLDFSNSWGRVSVVNFFTDGVAQAAVGAHVLDFTHWLDDQFSTSGSALSAARISTDLGDAFVDADGIISITDGNQVLVITDFDRDATTTDTWANMGQQDLQNALNGTTGTDASDYGNIRFGEASVATAGLVGATIDAMIMIENPMNAGEYKVFNADVSDLGDTDTFAITLVGVVDFGNSLDGTTAALTAANLAGSAVVV